MEIPLELDETGRTYLNLLYQKTEGNPSRAFSMFDIGSMMDLDRELSKKTAENLIGFGFIDIRTLSGAIGLTSDGIAEVEKESRENINPQEPSLVMGDEPIMGKAISEALDVLILKLKSSAGNLHLDYMQQVEFTSDLKTIDAQMASSRPKTAIIRETLISLSELLNQINALELRGLLERFLGGSGSLK
jgi:hypothetical protein